MTGVQAIVLLMVSLMLVNDLCAAWNACERENISSSVTVLALLLVSAWHVGLVLLLDAGGFL